MLFLLLFDSNTESVIKKHTLNSLLTYTSKPVREESHAEKSEKNEVFSQNFFHVLEEISLPAKLREVFGIPLRMSLVNISATANVEGFRDNVKTYFWQFWGK